ncbi:hypothetical protein GCM10027062_09500 [Nocardioides hungaricus]
MWSPAEVLAIDWAEQFIAGRKVQVFYVVLAWSRCRFAQAAASRLTPDVIRAGEPLGLVTHLASDDPIPTEERKSCFHRPRTFRPIVRPAP